MNPAADGTMKNNHILRLLTVVLTMLVGGIVLESSTKSTGRPKGKEHSQRRPEAQLVQSMQGGVELVGRDVRIPPVKLSARGHRERRRFEFGGSQAGYGSCRVSGRCSFPANRSKADAQTAFAPRTALGATARTIGRRPAIVALMQGRTAASAIRSARSRGSAVRPAGARSRGRVLPPATTSSVRNSSDPSPLVWWPAVAPAWALGGQGAKPCSEILARLPVPLVVVGRWPDPDRPARPALHQAMALDHGSHGLTPRGGLHHSFDSRSVNARLPRLRSATDCSSFRFSASSRRSPLASLTSMPPNFAFQR